MDVVAKHPRRMDQNVIYGSTNNGEMRERSCSEMVFNGPASREEKTATTGRRRERCLCICFSTEINVSCRNIVFALFEKRNHFSELKRDGTRLLFDNVKTIFFSIELATVENVGRVFFFFMDVLIPTASPPIVDRIPWAWPHSVCESVKGVIVVRLKSQA